MVLKTTSVIDKKKFKHDQISDSKIEEKTVEVNKGKTSLKLNQIVFNVLKI